MLSLVANPFRTALAEDKPAEKKDTPQLLLTLPLAVPRGAATKIFLRGRKLEGATAVRLSLPGATAKILSQGKADVPNGYDAARLGDMQVEAEVMLPADAAAGELTAVVVTPAGETPPFKLLYDPQLVVVADTEPNDGFRQAQALPLQPGVPLAVDGTIHQGQNVDVFKFTAAAGQKLVTEVQAARHGSALDSILLLHKAAEGSARGRLIATNDDAADSLDARLELPLPEAGAYYLTILDAHDQGSAAHAYRLLLRLN